MKSKDWELKKTDFSWKIKTPDWYKKTFDRESVPLQVDGHEKKFL